MKLCLECGAGFAASEWKCPGCAQQPALVGGFVALAPALATGGAGFPPGAHEQLVALEEQNFWFRARNRLIVWALRRHAPQLSRYLEIGCGTGYVLSGIAQAFPAATLVGSEVFSVGLPYAAARVKTAEFLQMDARHIPYREEFDVIGAFDVLEHIEEDEAVLAAMRQALRPAGVVAITVPQHPWLWSPADDNAFHVRRYRVGEMRKKLQRAGFTVELDTSFVSLLLPAMLASRLTQKRATARQDAASELDLPAWMNRLFEAVMNLEFVLIRAGLRFALGGSRLVVAKKSQQASS